MRDFRQLTIWQEGIKVVKKVYEITRLLPQVETYGIVSQMKRASISIPSNIAEGCSRSSEIDFKRFLEIAIGSSFELETQLVLVLELYPSLSKQETNNLIENLQMLQKQINSFITAIKKRI